MAAASQSHQERDFWPAVSSCSRASHAGRPFCKASYPKLKYMMVYSG